MKKIHFIFIIYLFVFNTFVQTYPQPTSLVQDIVVIFKVTKNFDIGFGRENSFKNNKHMSFVVNGPLVDGVGKPVGGWVDNKIQKKDWVNPKNYDGNFSVDNGIFGVDDQGLPFLFKYKDRHLIPDGSYWAFQNGLILVENSLNIRGTSTSKFQRSGIGFNKSGEIIIIISTKPVTLKNFANLFVSQNCVSAIYLDGGPYVGFSNKNMIYGLVENAMKLQFYHQ